MCRLFRNYEEITFYVYGDRGCCPECKVGWLKGNTCPHCGWVDPNPPKRLDVSSKDPSPPLKMITHGVPAWLLWLWRLFACRKGWHVWDETYCEDRHFLVCDACGEELDLA